MNFHLDNIEKYIHENNYNKNTALYVKMAFDQFSDNLDNKIQNRLMTELMLKYSQLSKTFEEQNQMLKETEEKLHKYNNQLEELVEKKVKEASDSQIATIYALVKLSESRDDDTGDHIERTSRLCAHMAKLLKAESKYALYIDDSYIENIYKASPLHDIGKVGIPDSILLKPGKLTNKEFKIMKTHVMIGYNTLKDVYNNYKQNKFLKMGIAITKYHHEKWDGSGYPDGTKGEEIPLSGRIMAIVDVYDALRSKRVYKDALSHEKSCEIIAGGSGTHFDPLLVEVFLKNHENFKQICCNCTLPQNDVGMT